MKSRTMIYAVFAPFMLLASAANGGVVLFNVSASGSGSFNGNSFERQSFSIDAVADGDDLFRNSAGIGVINSALTVTVDGLGSDTFSSETQTFHNTNALTAGFGDNGQSRAIIFVRSPDFAGWDLISPIGPVVGEAQVNIGDEFSTTSGSFRIDSIDGFTASFQSIPEPNCAFLGFAMFGGATLQRRSREQ